MKRQIVFAFITLSLIFVIPDAQAGTSEVWKKCDTLNSKVTFGGTTYVCCDIGWITGTSCTASTCTDTDKSDALSFKGTCTDSSGSYPDTCSGGKLTQYSCSLNVCKSSTMSCTTPYSCGDGTCSEGPTTACNDGVNNDGDNKIDYVAPSGYVSDDGCKSSIDPTECFDDNDFVPDTYTSKDGQCCSGKYDYFNQKCIPASNPCAKKYTDSINCNADPDCNWCSGLCQTKACNSCITDKTTCRNSGCSWCDAKCGPPIPSSGSCSGSNSCSGTEVIIDMAKGNTINSCINQAGSPNSNQGQWYKFKGALGQQANITFTTNGKAWLYVWNQTNDCNALFNSFTSYSGQCRLNYPSASKCLPLSFFTCQLSTGQSCTINKMPPGGVLAAVSSTCDNSVPYTIEISTNSTMQKCTYA